MTSVAKDLDQDPRVLVEVTDGVAELVFNRPDKLNALDRRFFREMLEALRAVDADPSVRAVVVHGAGRAFSAGLDLEEFRTFASDAQEEVRSFDGAGGSRRDPELAGRLVAALRGLRAPTIAAVRGPAIGGGLQLALACDLRIVGPDVAFAAKEIEFGITLDLGGTQLLARLTGSDRALELILTGRVVGAQEAAELRLATRIAEDPLQEARALARAIAARNPEAVAATKALVQLAETSSVADGVRVEGQMLRWNVGRPNQTEAALARLAGRPATFVGLDPGDLPPPLLGRAAVGE